MKIIKRKKKFQPKNKIVFIRKALLKYFTKEYVNYVIKNKTLEYENGCPCPKLTIREV